MMKQGRASHSRHGCVRACRKFGTAGLVKLLSADVAAEVHAGVLQATNGMGYATYNYW